MNLSGNSERIEAPPLRIASVRVSRLLGAPPATVFDAWLNADEARGFLFADGVADDGGTQIDARVVGGGFRIVRHSHAGAVEYSGKYLEIDRPHLLVFSLFVEKYAQLDDRVTVEFASVGEQALLVLTHELSLPNAADRFRIQREWMLVLDGLAALCARGTVSGAAPPCARRWMGENSEVERRFLNSRALTWPE
jgi:uncharacterized protein YndB with AHSA1/START domain